EPEVTVRSETWLTWGSALKLVIFFTQRGHASKPKISDEKRKTNTAQPSAPAAACTSQRCSSSTSRQEGRVSRSRYRSTSHHASGRARAKRAIAGKARINADMASSAPPKVQRWVFKAQAPSPRYTIQSWRRVAPAQLEPNM